MDVEGCHWEAGPRRPASPLVLPALLISDAATQRTLCCLLRSVSGWSPERRHAVGRFLSTLGIYKVNSAVLWPCRRDAVSIYLRTATPSLFGLDPCVGGEDASDEVREEAPPSFGTFKDVQLCVSGTYVQSEWIGFKRCLCFTHRFVFYAPFGLNDLQSEAPSLQWNISPLWIDSVSGSSSVRPATVRSLVPVPWSLSWPLWTHFDRQSGFLSELSRCWLRTLDTCFTPSIYSLWRPHQWASR